MSRYFWVTLYIKRIYCLELLLANESQPVTLKERTFIIY